MGTVHRLSRVRAPRPLPALPMWAKAALGELGIFDMGPVIGFELWGRGDRSAVMMVDGRGAALNACLSESYPKEGFATRAAARAWAVAFFAGLGREVPEIRSRRRFPAESNASIPSEASAGKDALDDKKHPEPKEMK